MIRTTAAQKDEIKRAIKSNKFYRIEKVWNFLVTDILSNSSNRNHYIELFCNKEIEIDTYLDIWYEAMPLSSRRGKSGNSEGNTKLDLAFGNIKNRANTKSGIEYDPEKKGSWVCFVESKLLSDCSTKVSHDPLKNQIIRVIENLLCFQKDDKFPQNLFFALLTPKIFRENPKSKLYGYKMNEYKTPKDILDDIKKSQIPERRQKNWCYPEDLEDRIKMLKITWITYEEIFEKEYEIMGLDLTTIEKEPEKIEKIEKRLNVLANGV